MPEGFDVLFAVLAAAVVALAVAALVVLFRQRAAFSTFEFVAWTVAILVLPVIASILFLAIRTGQRREHAKA